MSQTLRCQCGFRVPFQEEDRGFEVYCPSCARVCAIPLAEEPAPPAEAPPSPAAAAETASEAGGGDAVTAGESVAVETRPPVPPPAAVAAVPDRTIPPAEPTAPARAREPAAEPQPPAHAEVEPSPRSSVFSASGVDLSDRVVGSVACLCGRQLSITVGDFGMSIYCPACGAEVPVGKTWEEISAHRTKAISEEAPSAARPAPQARLRWVRSPLGIAVLLLIVASTAYGGYLTWSQGAKVLEWTGLAKSLVRPAPTDGVPADFDPELVTSEAIQQLRESEDPFQPLTFALGWQKGLQQYDVPEQDLRYAELRDLIRQVLAGRASEMLTRIQGLASREDAQAALETARTWSHLLRAGGLIGQDPRLVELEQAARQLLEKADPITLEMIAALLQQSDREEALVQAQLWQQALYDREVPPADPRQVRLEEVIREFQRRLTPSPEAIAETVNQFRDAVQTMADQLRAQQFREARQTSDQIERMLQEHPDDLAHLTKRYLGLKAKLRRAELVGQGAANIRRLLAEAQQKLEAAEGSQTAEALVCRAQAKALARITPMTPADADDLARLASGLQPKLQLARGRRAVSDAKRCAEAGDKEARNREVRRATALLPGLPESQIRGLLEEVRAWDEEIKKDKPAKGAAAEPKSEFAREIGLRDSYEDTLEAYGDGDSGKFVRACRGYRDAAQRQNRSVDPRFEELERLFFDMVEMQVAGAIEPERPPDDETLRQRIVALHEALDQADFWKHSPRWKSLDAALRRHGDRFAQQSLQQADALAQQGRLEEAVGRISTAVATGDPATAGRARLMQQRWQTELQRRTDARAEAETWRKIEQLVQDKQAVEGWAALDQFLRTYPDSKHRSQAEKYKAHAETFVAGKFDAELDRAVKMLEDYDLYKAFAQLRTLRRAAISDRLKQSLQRVESKAEEVRRAVENEFLRLGKAKRMIEDDEIAEVRRVAQLMLAVDPDHAEAHQLAEQADRKAGIKARKYLQQAKLYKNLNPQKHRDYLRKCVYLDPYGESGHEAHQLLSAG